MSFAIYLEIFFFQTWFFLINKVTVPWQNHRREITEQVQNSINFNPRKLSNGFLFFLRKLSFRFLSEIQTHVVGIHHHFH